MQLSQAKLPKNKITVSCNNSIAVESRKLRRQNSCKRWLTSKFPPITTAQGTGKDCLFINNTCLNGRFFRRIFELNAISHNIKKRNAD